MAATQADGLLEHAIGYAIGSVAAVTPGQLGRPTPCRDWDLGMLLRHGCESLAALGEGVTLGCVAATPAADCTRSIDLPCLFTARAENLLDSRVQHAAASCVLVGRLPLPADMFATAGALEIAVHGWDVAQASGNNRPIPAELAVRLLAVAPLLITDADRAPLFGPPVATVRDASASDQLTAFLGRTWTPGQPE